ncbi:putative benzoate 4-monooxygenase cytochrome P450 [Mytilinidion resinicola]|uniref:Benzoate 4-monooxygenase cytochrome P450 n=1 Tax=Mytilinidion resinicola TaxID=574789 RepID=A0A6A6XZF8_9PEZI|nr:putative benzoate 4-monooxygenase cytochrome P450 [Mytilinidion resinicola]KAF2801643.1 putative benzoate 4-monooxygenase cytochrome P450 [Mytilinidion resinicola]
MGNLTQPVVLAVTGEQSSAGKLLVSASVSAFILHQVFFKRVEVDFRPVSLGAGLGAAFIILVYCFGFLLALASSVSFLLSLWVNMLVYRLAFHPLKHFPGPVPAKLSKFWAVKKVLDSNYQWYKVALSLKAKYGDYVRTGPREILIFDPEAIAPVLGYSSKTLKGPFYDSMEDSVNTTRDKEFHRKRRKIWDNAMKTSLADYAPRIEDFTDKLIARIGRHADQAIVLNDLMIHYSYDVMSLLAYGKSMGFVEGKSTDVADSILKNIMDGVYAIGLLLHVPWLFTIVTTFAFAIGPLKQWNDWSRHEVDERREVKNPKPDLMTHLIASTPDDHAGRELLFSESRLIISAGSDTTATALTFLFVLLSLQEQSTTLANLRAELDTVFSKPSDDKEAFSCMRPLPMLDAVINEGLRLYPSVYFPSQRVTPAAGMTINGRYIPGDTIISIPAYALSHDPRCFEQPDEFIPERWTTRPELTINKTGFMPFMTGPYDCAGKKLAMMELRSVVARIVKDWDWRVIGEEGKKWDREAWFGGVKDHFIAGAPKARVVFEKRV